MKNNDLCAIAQCLKQETAFAVICHENPDGDALGSLFALGMGLMQLQKQVELVCVDEVPELYRSLPCVQLVQHTVADVESKVLVCVDCADRARAGAVQALLPAAKFVINIDHHPSNDLYGDLHLVDPQACATGELIASVLETMDVRLDAQIAQCLLTAISTDTGHFQHGNTTPHALMLAARLMEAGADMQRLAREIYQHRKLSKTKLLGRALDSIEMLCEDRAAMMVVTQQDFADCGAQEAETEGLIDYAREIDTVLVAVMLRQAQRGCVKVSMRSDGSVDVGAVATAHGGGGHRAAAGFSLPGNLDAARDQMCTIVQEILPPCRESSTS